MNYTDDVSQSVRFEGRCSLGIDRREEGNVVKEGEKCGRSSIWPGFAQPWGSKAA